MAHLCHSEKKRRFRLFPGLIKIYQWVRVKYEKHIHIEDKKEPFKICDSNRIKQLRRERFRKRDVYFNSGYFEQGVVSLLTITKYEF